MFNLFSIENKDLIVYLTKAHTCNKLVNKVIEENKNNKLLLWQKDEYNVDCPTMIMKYGMNLLKTLDSCLNDFDILIIDHLFDDYTPDEINLFLKEIKSNKKYKNKHFVVFITKFTENSTLKIDDFVNTKDNLLLVAADCFLVNYDLIDYPFSYLFENIKTNELEKMKIQ